MHCRCGHSEQNPITKVFLEAFQLNIYVEIQTFHFEIRDIISQFIAAFDDVVINRYDKDRTPRSNVKVRYVYSPKERVLFDLINKAQNLTLPVIAVNVTSITRDESRVFSKLYGFDESDHYPDNKPGKNHAHVNMPVPIDIDIAMSILTEYQTDMDQILSNFIPYSNPYVVIAWKIPDVMGTATVQEIRSQVLWSGTMNMEYPTDTTKSDKYRIESSTTFTIKGWLFPKETPKQQNIFFIKSNFSSSLLECDNFYTANAESAPLPIHEHAFTHTFSAAPICSSIYFQGITLNEIFNLQKEESNYPMLLLGLNLSYTTNILLSSPASILDYPQTLFNFDYYPPVSGYVVPLSSYKITNDNLIQINLPELISNGKFKIVVINRAGWSTFNTTMNIVDAPSYLNLPPPVILTPSPTINPVVIGKYYYSMNNNDWYDLDNWFADSQKNTPANRIPGVNTDVVILPDTLRPVVELDNANWINPKSIDASSTGITFNSFIGKKVYSPIIGDVIYSGNASHG
jgi:hypothetical protein